MIFEANVTQADSVVFNQFEGISPTAAMDMLLDIKSIFARHQEFGSIYEETVFLALERVFKALPFLALSELSRLLKKYENEGILSSSRKKYLLRIYFSKK